MRLQVWDTGGAERFRRITTAYLRGAVGILLVYDITSRHSFNTMGGWLKEVQLHQNSKDEEEGRQFAAQNGTVITLVGNKTDLDHRREVIYEEGRQFAAQNGLAGFFETSAKTGHGVDESFIFTAHEATVIQLRAIASHTKLR